MDSKKLDKHTESTQQLIEKRQRLAKISHILDTAFTIPILNIRVGMDAIIGMVPVVGDIIGGLLSLYFIGQAIRLKTPISTIFRMLINIAIEVLVGLVPVFGDLFDVSWRANLKNYHLIDKHLTEKLDALGYQEQPPMEQEPQGPSVILQILLVILALTALYVLRQPIYDSLSTIPQYIYN